MTKIQRSTMHSSATVSLDKERVIVCRLQGFIDESIVKKSLAETKVYVRQLQATRRPVYLLVDALEVRGQSSEARSLAKTLGEFGIRKLAVCNRSFALGMVIQYLIRASGLAEVSRVFSSRNAAMHWLTQTHSPVAVKNHRRLPKYTSPVLIFLAIIALTGIAWYQAASQRSTAELAATQEHAIQTKGVISDRLDAYITALRGYRSFFQASEFVSASEFETYFAASHLQEYYPGFSAVSFARDIPANQQQSFTASMKQQASPAFPQYNNVTIHPASNRTSLYPITYVAPATPATNYGFDLGSTDERRLTLERARDTGDVAATGTIDLNASRGDESLPRRPGFFITIPIYKGADVPNNGVPTTAAARRASIYGFVNAVFEDSELFSDVFDDTSRDGVRYTITNATSGEMIYTYNPTNAAIIQSQAAYSDTIQVGGQTLQLTLYTIRHFGQEGLSRYVPSLIAAGGIIFALLAAALTTSQVRRKDQAIKLAEDMTEDLNHERDNAILQQQKDEAILSSIGDAVFAVDTKGEVILFNHAAELITGYTQEEALGQPYEKILRFLRPGDGASANLFIATALSGRPAKMGDDTVLERPDRTTIPVADSAAPVVNANGQVEGAVIVFRDITREKELEHLKNDFVAMASHELRTPMGAIRAFVAMILAGDYGPVNKNLVEPLSDIKHSTLRLVNLVNDLLDVARIEAGRMKFTITDIGLDSLLQETTAALTPLAKEKGITLQHKGAAKTLVQADSDKVKQVLTNLIGNALKFTDKGSITVELATPTADSVAITVSDTGLGIAESDQAKLFGKFEQISSATQGRPTGTGLGLYISRQIIRKLGGELWLERSTVGKGSVFAFSLVRSHTATAKEVKARLEHEAALHPDQK